MSTFSRTSDQQSASGTIPLVVLPPRNNEPRCDEPLPSTADECRSDCDQGPADEALAGSVTWLLVLTLLQKMLGLVRSIFVCRWLDPFQVGLWGMAQAAMDTTVPLLMLSIPGSFSRYMEYYRQRGQLRSFLRWSTVSCLLTFALGFSLCYGLRGTLSRLAFGDASHVRLATMGLVCLVPAAVFAFGIELLLGARQGRTVSLGHFIRGILFTGMCLLLLAAWRQDATAMVVAYGGSFLLGALVLAWPIGRLLRHYPPDLQPLRWSETCRRIGPAVMGCWAMDFLNNLFLTVDRYMLVHWSVEPNDAVLMAIGNYEAALVFPLLLATVAFMSARMVLPHLARDWERGHHDRVVDSMNLTVQVVAALLILGGWLLELLAPSLFAYAFRGQFPAGRAVLPVAVTFYIWMAISWVVMNFLWCAERTPWGVLAMVAGLAVNVTLNAAWISTAGILGAAQATLTANAVQLAILLGITAVFGMPWRVRTLFACSAPFLLSCGVEAGAVAAILAIGVMMGNIPRIRAAWH